ncbi:uncharacterized protein LOC119107042 [Pollicipes pollicipes]|uniref:uncharacterized protein LOC119107042 n=1 Tax=Pollicipes pollicipes TaxID=41117 RepID=UPI001884BB6B|nr:uncharacterized protein LOC119107042 [Pollicipes pollicipes]
MPVNVLPRVLVGAAQSRDSSQQLTPQLLPSPGKGAGRGKAHRVAAETKGPPPTLARALNYWSAAAAGPASRNVNARRLFQPARRAVPCRAVPCRAMPWRLASSPARALAQCAVTALCGARASQAALWAGPTARARAALPRRGSVRRRAAPPTALGRPDRGGAPDPDPGAIRIGGVVRIRPAGQGRRSETVDQPVSRDQASGRTAPLFVSGQACRPASACDRRRPFRVRDVPSGCRSLCAPVHLQVHVLWSPVLWLVFSSVRVASVLMTFFGARGPSVRGAMTASRSFVLTDGMYGAVHPLCVVSIGVAIVRLLGKRLLSCG